MGREAMLNKNALVRAGALRFAAAAAGFSISDVGDDDAIPDPKPGSQNQRGDLFDLTRMLEGLFVENFALRKKFTLGIGGVSTASTSAAETLSSSSSTGAADMALSDQFAADSGPTESLDLSRFVLAEDVGSDD